MADEGRPCLREVPNPLAVPAFERATTWTPEADSAVYGDLLADFEEGYGKRLAFGDPFQARRQLLIAATISSGASSWM